MLTFLHSLGTSLFTVSSQTQLPFRCAKSTAHTTSLTRHVRPPGFWGCCSDRLELPPGPCPQPECYQSCFQAPAKDVFVCMVLERMRESTDVLYRLTCWLWYVCVIRCCGWSVSLAARWAAWMNCWFATAVGRLTTTGVWCRRFLTSHVDRGDVPAA